MEAPARAATPVRSASPTSTPTNSIRSSPVASVAPVVDQVQFNPSAYRKALLDACAERGVALEAYSPLGTGAQLGDPVVAGIADRLGRTPRPGRSCAGVSSAASRSSPSRPIATASQRTPSLRLRALRR
jgi:hypothetical protein